MSSLNYIARGEGQPVILIHGISASLHDWEALMPDLRLAGYHAIAVDLLGHGESDKPEDPNAYTSEDIYTAFEEWADGLKDQPPYALVGHSYGGYLGLVYALRHPQRVQTMVLINPFYSPNQLSSWLQWLSRRPSWGIKALQCVPLTLIDFALGWDPADMARFSPQARWQIAVDYKRASPNVLNIPRSVADLTTELHQVKAPSLVIWGENDLTLNPRSFPRLVSSLPCATGYPIPDSGHQPHIGNPDLVNRLVLEFIANHGSNSHCADAAEGSPLVSTVICSNDPQSSIYHQPNDGGIHGGHANLAR